MKHTKRTLKRMAAIMVAFAVAFTITPMISGDMNVHAATPKKPAKVGSLNATATSQTTITLRWNKVKTKGTKGYVVYRYVPSSKKWLAVKNVKKATIVTFKDQKLKAGTNYKYRVRAYTTYKQYYNTKTKKWVNKRPAKKYWKTKLSRTRYRWGAYSNNKTFKTKSATKTQNPTTSPRTKYECTNFLGNSYTLWKDSDGAYWDASTGGTKITNLSEYDRTVDGRWSYGQTYVQQGGVTVVGVYYRPTNNHLVDVEVYNGSASNVKLIVREETKKYLSSEGNDFGQTFVLDSQGNRIGMYYSVPNDPSKIRFDLSSSFGFDGFVGGTIHIDGYYDFNKNGVLTDDEFIGTRAITVNPKQAATDAYDIAKAATTYYGTSTYQADMAAIRAYLYKNYEHNSELNGVNMYTCIGGANIMKAWSIRNYNVLGTVYVLPSSSHEEFFPVRDNPYTVRESFTAEGYLASAPPGSASHTSKLARLEADVTEYMAAGK